MQSALVEQFYEAGDAAFRVTARSLEDLFAASGLGRQKDRLVLIRSPQAKLSGSGVLACGLLIRTNLSF